MTSRSLRLRHGHIFSWFNSYPAFCSNIGSELETLIGEETSYIVSEFPRMIEDALSVDSRIIEVSDFNYTVNGDSMLWTFTVRTVYGDFGEEVMI